MDRNASGRARRVPVLVGMLLVAASPCVVWAGSAAAKSGTHVLYVSPRGSDSKACTKAAPCKTISGALAKGHAGDTIKVAHGRYAEQVTIKMDVRVIGVGKPVVDAKNLANGFLLTGAGAAGASVQGFTVKNANFEGILAMNATRVTIRNNVVENNDLGVSATPPTGECAAQGPIPGDCGEGIHLWSTSHSFVSANKVTNNQGGILLTDETGPTAHNTISNNRVTNNVFDCGITLAGHSPNAVTAAGPQPKVAGVFDNTISGNTVNGNGTKGQGGGILLAAGAPGSAVYDNTVKNNTANGNGLGGVTLHSHAPGQDLNGNRITGNSLSNDGLHGYPNGAPGDSDAGINGTVGIIVFSAVSPLTGTVIAGNHIRHVTFGIWTQNVPAIRRSANTFGAGVTTPIFQK
jgi:parallel beta-helix repeat protein